MEEEVFNAETIAALEEAEEMIRNSAKYKRYATFREAVDDVMEVSADDVAKWEAGEWILTEDLLQAIEDTRNRRNLYGPFATGEEAVASMLEDD